LAEILLTEAADLDRHEPGKLAAQVLDVDAGAAVDVRRILVREERDPLRSRHRLSPRTTVLRYWCATVPPLATVVRSKSSGVALASIRQLRPMIALAGIRARLPTTVIPVFRLPGSRAFGVLSSPTPSCASVPTSISLSSTQRSTRAPDRIVVSFMITE